MVPMLHCIHTAEPATRLQILDTVGQLFYPPIAHCHRPHMQQWATVLMETISMKSRIECEKALPLLSNLVLENPSCAQQVVCAVSFMRDLIEHINPLHEDHSTWALVHIMFAASEPNLEQLVLMEDVCAPLCNTIQYASNRSEAFLYACVQLFTTLLDHKGKVVARVCTSLLRPYATMLCKQLGILEQCEGCTLCESTYCRLGRLLEKHFGLYRVRQTRVSAQAA